MIKIYLVDDHQIVKQGIKSILMNDSQYEIVGESNNAESLLEQIKNIDIDLIITDITLEGMSGIELTKKVKKIKENNTKILILSMHADKYHIGQCFEAGANGYLLKDFSPDELKLAINKIMKGEIYAGKSISQLLASNFLSREFSDTKKSGPNVNITKREKEIIKLISMGLSNKEIAEKIFVSISTVDAHRYNILKKLDVKNTAEMLMKAIKLNILES